MNKNIKLYRWIYSGLLIALTFTATFLIKIPLPIVQGYIHPGDSIIILSGMLFGGPIGAIVGAFGSSLADLLGGYQQWILPTFIIKGFLGYIVGYSFNKKNYSIKTSFSFGIISIGFFISSIIFLQSQFKYVISNFSNLDINTITTIPALDKIKKELLILSIIILLLIILFKFIVDKISSYNISFLFLFGLLINFVIVPIGYYLAASLIYGSFISPLISIPFDMIQYISSVFIAFILYVPLNQKITSLRK